MSQQKNDQRIASRIASAFRKDWQKNKTRLLITAGIAVLLLATCVGTRQSNNDSRFGTTETQALTKCQFALKGIAKNPTSAEVPYVGDLGSGNEFYFAWGASSKPVRMENGFGLMISTGASCIVDKTTGKITSLSLDGQSGN